MFQIINATFPFLFSWSVSGTSKDSYESVSFNRIILNSEGEFISLEGEGGYDKWIGDRGNGISGHSTDATLKTPSFEEACATHNLNLDMLRVSTVWNGHPLVDAVLASGVPDSISVTAYGGSDSHSLINDDYKEHLLLDQDTKCVLVVEEKESYGEYWTEETFWWLFPNKSEWVRLGQKQSYYNLKKKDAVPSWLQEEVRLY